MAKIKHKDRLLYKTGGPFRALYKIWFVLVFLATGTLLYPFLYLFRALHWKKTLFFIKSWIWLSLLQLFLGLFVVIRKKNKTAFPNEPFIVCANHCSYLDIVFLYAIHKQGPIFFLGKESLKKFPFVGMFFKDYDLHVPIKREIKSEASQALKQIGEKLDQGYPIVIFPEGTQTKKPPFMNTFKVGAFKLAIEKQVPIVPMTFLNNWKLLSDLGKFTGPSRPGISRVVIHEPVYTKGLNMEDLLSLQERVYHIIEDELIQYYPEYYGSEN